MKKKGFTLPELLVVIVIIGVIAVIAIPSVILINKNINKRLYNSKVDMIISAAELYASDNPDIFNGTSEVRVYVAELIKKNYLKVETSEGEDCLKVEVEDNGSTKVIETAGCIVNPVEDKSMNMESVVIRKEAVGVTATFNGDTLTVTGDTLVSAVCERFESGAFLGKTGENSYCKCDGGKIKAYNPETGETGAEVNACIISGQEKNNYLLYDNVYWRVMGLYDIYDNGKLSAKMITDDNVDINQ